jgi:hypothetical protein
MAKLELTSNRSIRVILADVAVGPAFGVWTPTPAERTRFWAADPEPADAGGDEDANARLH